MMMYDDGDDGDYDYSNIVIIAIKLLCCAACYRVSISEATLARSKAFVPERQWTAQDARLCLGRHLGSGHFLSRRKIVIYPRSYC